MIKDTQIIFKSLLFNIINSHIYFKSHEVVPQILFKERRRNIICRILINFIFSLM